MTTGRATTKQTRSKKGSAVRRSASTGRYADKPQAEYQREVTRLAKAGTPRAAPRRVGKVSQYLVLSAIEKDHLIRRGLPSSFIKEVSLMSGTPQYRIMEIVGVAKSTVSGATRNDKPLSAEDSDRLARLAEIADLAAKVLGGRDAANLWLNSPIPALGNERPIDLLGSSPGCSLVEDTLNQIAASAYA